MVEVAFYGDDFTGSTDALAQFARCGLRSVLLVELPPAAELRKLASEYDVIGVAGIARSLAPSEQEAEIRPILTALRDLGPRVVQYKICSTADSSPELGSLGRALEIGRSIFGPAVVPVLAAQPELGRYTIFSHHFATEAGTTHRLDRQPTMANHPATPMTESDLRLHLAAQTNLRIAAMHLTSYDALATRGLASTDHAADGLASTDVDVVVLDALTDDDLRVAGKAVVAAGIGGPTFAVGSGGLSRALAMELTQVGDSPALAGDGRPADGLPMADHVDKQSPLAPRSQSAGHGDRQVLVVSGSQSKRTREQIERAMAAGWAVLQLGDGAVAQHAVTSGPEGPIVGDGEAAHHPVTPGPEEPILGDGEAAQRAATPGPEKPILGDGVVAQQAVAAGPEGLLVGVGGAIAQRAVSVLRAGAPGVLVHSGQAEGRSATEVLGVLARELAEVVRVVASGTDVRRLLIAGGDTSGRVLRELGVTALELVPTSDRYGRGVALCRTVATQPDLNGLEVLLKPGQLGAPDLFETIRTT